MTARGEPTTVQSSSGRAVSAPPHSSGGPVPPALALDATLSALPAQPGARGVDSSCNFLGVDILNAAGLELDGYWGQLAELKQTYTAWTPKYFAAADGALYAAPEDCLDETGLKKMDGMVQFLQESLFPAQ